METSRILRDIQKNIQIIHCCQRCVILERSKRNPNVFLRRGDLLPAADFLANGYENEESGFQTVDLRQGPKSLLNELVSDEYGNHSNINIGVTT
jgi:hypothetical protein